MTPWHEVPSEQQGRPVTVTVTWQVLWQVPQGQLCRQETLCPAAKSGPPEQG